MNFRISRFSAASLVIAIGLAACSNGGDEVVEVIQKRGVDVAQIGATVETTPVQSLDDAADDPAIWVHPTSPSSSLIIGTDKRFGLMVYDMSGATKQALEQGRLNNVDLRQRVEMASGVQDIAVATNRTDNSLDVFYISQSGRVSFAGSQALDLPEPMEPVCISMQRVFRMCL